MGEFVYLLDFRWWWEYEKLTNSLKKRPEQNQLSPKLKHRSCPFPVLVFVQKGCGSLTRVNKGAMAYLDIDIECRINVRVVWWQDKNKKGECTSFPTSHQNHHNTISTVAPSSCRRIIIKINRILQGLHTFEPRLYVTCCVLIIHLLLCGCFLK